MVFIAVVLNWGMVNVDAFHLILTAHESWPRHRPRRYLPPVDRSFMVNERTTDS
jgi:hypothetical protein